MPRPSTRTAAALFHAVALLAIVTFAATNADAIEKCKVKVDKKTGVIRVDASPIQGTLRWGDTEGAEDNDLFNFETCLSGEKAKKCELADPATAAAKLPPAGCVLYVNDDSTVGCQAWISGCTPGLRVATNLQEQCAAGTDVVFEGCNVHVRDGSGDTGGAVNGLGNLIVGYNEDSDPAATRTGSHNLIVGSEHGFASYGGFVGGKGNTLTERFATVSGGNLNTASGAYASVSGGDHNLASGSSASIGGGLYNTADDGRATVSGGARNVASGPSAAVGGGLYNTAMGSYAAAIGGSVNVASGYAASISGGFQNGADASWSSVNGGAFNYASGGYASVSGGRLNTADAYASWVSGGTYNTASGALSSVSGGSYNTASGSSSSVSGGANRSAGGAGNWRGGSYFSND